MLRLRRPAAIPAAWFLSSASALAAGQVWTPREVAALRTVASAAISPDGGEVAYVVSVPRRPGEDDDGPPWNELWLVGRDEGEPRPFVTGKVDVSSPQWTADGRSIAFLAKRGDDKNVCLYLIPRDGGEARRAVSLASSIGAYSLAPDGRRAAIAAVEPEPEARRKAREKGYAEEVYEEDVRPSRLWIAELFATGEPRRLEVEGSVRQVRWSPVDERIAISVTPRPLVDDEYVRQRIRIVDAKGGEVLRRIENPGKLGAIAWSPDGRYLAAITALDEHDPSAGRLWLWPADGAETAPLRALPDDFAGDVVAFGFVAPGALLCATHQGVLASLEKLSFSETGAAARTTLVAPGGPILSSLSLSKDGLHAAFVAQTAELPPEVWTMSHGDPGPRRRTHSNPEAAKLALAKQEVFRWKARDGLELEGILVRPLDEVAGRRYPLVVYVHGGPEAHESDGWQTSYSKPGQVAAARGYAVFHPNYRGSTGRGVAFAKLSQGDPGGKEFDDVVDGVDALVESGLVDAAKVAVTGGSYGGYATAWLATRYSERFAAGVMFVGISDKVSKVGTTDIPDEEYLVHALERPWEDWAKMLDRSPITRADRCRTPLLILHGKDDPRVNPGQSREMYRHLKLRGQAPVRLVLYPGEGHGNRKACARLDYSLRMLEWIEHYLGGPGGEPPPWDIDHAAQEAPARPAAGAGAEAGTR